MPDSPGLVRVVRVVAVSPGDVTAERERLEEVVEELNRTLAPSHGCILSLWRWETDAHPGLHLEGPQGRIDDAMQIANADVVVGIFWTRFGTPTLDSGSGTEHELRRAWSAWREHGRPEVMVYFCERKSRSKNSAQAAQIQQLLSFREAMPKELLWWPYLTLLDFERAVRGHLTTFVLALQSAPSQTQKPKAARHNPRHAEPHCVTADDVAVKQYDPETDSVRAEIIAAAGSSLPFTTSSDYTTRIDSQGEVYMEFLQRAGGLDTSDDAYLFDPLGHMTLGLRPGLRRGTSLQITTAIDATGRLTAEATDPGSADKASAGATSPPVDQALQVRVRRERP